MPPDRVFGRVEKEYRKKEVIISPEEYYNVLQNHGTVRKIGKDWNVCDYKLYSKKTYKVKVAF